MAQDSLKIQKGTFEGDGTKTVTISCNFYPDLILISSAEDTSDDGTFRGILTDFIWRDEFVFSSYDNNASTITGIYYGGVNAQGTMSNYNETTMAYRCCHAVVNGTSITIDRDTTVGNYMNHHMYKYIFIKLPE